MSTTLFDALVALTWAGAGVVAVLCALIALHLAISPSKKERKP